YGM
ncbi:FAD dependent oxidoreductase family protein, partial [Vibrio parahaemolyticus SBR10290]